MSVRSKILELNLPVLLLSLSFPQGDRMDDNGEISLGSSDQTLKATEDEASERVIPVKSQLPL